MISFQSEISIHVYMIPIQYFIPDRVFRGFRMKNWMNSIRNELKLNEQF